MQVTDMRSLRTLCAGKRLFSLTLQKKLTSRPSFISCAYSANPNFPHHFLSTPRRTIHSTGRRFGDESAAADEEPFGWKVPSKSSSDHPASRNPKGNGVEAIYDPLTGRLVTRKVNQSNNKQEPVSTNQSENGASADYADAWRDRSLVGSVSSSSNNGVVQSFGSSKKKGKSKMNWVCSDCGNSEGQWWGSCPSCRSVGTMKVFHEVGDDRSRSTGFEVSENVVSSWLPAQPADAAPMRLTDVNKGVNQSAWRIPLFGSFGAEVARVLGGGLVPGSLVLVGGDPGVGKSTLVLQIAAIIAEGYGMGKSAPVVYVSGEESVEQIGNRADRMKIGTSELFLYSSTDIEDILGKVQNLSPQAIIIDSIQTVYLKGVTGSAGGVFQVKECTSALLRFVKKTKIPVFLVGHVTKSGDIAGPRVLEHIVDAVLYMEGEKQSSYRLLRSVKNRFGSTDELGVFEMSQSGLQAVSNPSLIFLTEQYSDSEVLVGLAVAVVLDGSRAFIIEIQALCAAGSSVSGHVNGIKESRANMIISVLKKQAGLKLQESDVFLNVVSGVTLKETAGDLAIAAAICSSFLEVPIPCDVAFIGEIGLAGELRTVPRMEKRVNTVAKLGYKKCIVPKSAEKSLSAIDAREMNILGCRNLKEMINNVFI